mmetsp:Transcript_13702/g.38570  ORF Transcript_13702/g.38570 Transcript_13702/m.38570 type:complete len:260 (-) Transcript_13702:89-868(-)
MGVTRVFDSVRHQIEHVGIGRFKVHFETKSPGSFVVQSHFHSFEGFEIAFDAGITISSRKNIRRRNRSYCVRIFSLVPGKDPLHGQFSLGFHFGLGHVTTICQSLLNERDCQFVEILEVVTAVGGSFGCPSQPFQVVHEGIDVLLGFGVGIRVIVSEDAASVFRGNAQLFECQREIHVDGFSVTHVKVTVRFWGESGSNDGPVGLGVLGNQIGRILGPLEFTGRQGIGSSCRFCHLCLFEGKSRFVLYSIGWDLEVTLG